MNTTIWTFKAGNFTVDCEEEEQSFIDPRVHSQIVIDAINRGDGILMRLRARVCWRSVEVEHAVLGDCIYVCDDDGYTIIKDHSYRYKVVRWAISAARKSLAEIQSELPDLYLRKTA
jgi:hypothetical protein